MLKRISAPITLVALVAALAVAGCGSSSSSSTSSSSGNSASSVASRNPIAKVAFNSPQYLGVCEKDMETPNSKGAALTASQAKTFCGCVQQQAQAKGLSSKSETSISDADFKTLYTACESQMSGGGSSGSSGTGSSAGASGSSGSAGGSSGSATSGASSGSSGSSSASGGAAPSGGSGSSS